MTKENTIYYQQKMHHRQNLRAGIFPKVYDDLQVNQNPSAVSRKVYQSLYKDSMITQLNKQNRLSSYRDKDTYQKNNSSSIFANAGDKIYRNSQYPDYHQDKYKKIDEHIYKNDDGGRDFFRSSEMYEKNIKQKYQQSMKQTLAKQLKDKERNLSMQKGMKLSQNQRFNQNLQKYKEYQAIQKRQHLKLKDAQRQEQLKNLEQEKAKRNRHSIFSMNQISRHNPITNPIEYHIDNPYILRQIQTKNYNVRAQL